MAQEHLLPGRFLQKEESYHVKGQKDILFHSIFYSDKGQPL